MIHYGYGNKPLKGMSYLTELIGAIWALPITLLGVLALITTGGWVEWNRYKGLRFVFAPRKWWWFPKRFNGLNLGGITLVKREVLDTPMHIHRLLCHEDEHRRQCYVLGPWMIVAYLLGMMFAAFLYGKPYWMSYLEICARHVPEDGRVKIQER